MVEDNKFNQIITSSILKKMGVSKVDVVANGQEALSFFAEKKYDFIIMDCQMPVMDGFSAAKRIRQLEREKGLLPVKIIALSAQVNDEVARMCKEAGMDLYLSKPIRPEKLKAALTRVFKRG